MTLGDAAWTVLENFDYRRCSGWVAFDTFAYRAGGYAYNSNKNKKEANQGRVQFLF